MRREGTHIYLNHCEYTQYLRHNSFTSPVDRWRSPAQEPLALPTTTLLSQRNRPARALTHTRCGDARGIPGSVHHFPSQAGSPLVTRTTSMRFSPCAPHNTPSSTSSSGSADSSWYRVGNCSLSDDPRVKLNQLGVEWPHSPLALHHRHEVLYEMRSGHTEYQPRSKSTFWYVASICAKVEPCQPANHFASRHS
eukprot:2032264-Prymnesium_polylepis.1